MYRAAEHHLGERYRYGRKYGISLTLEFWILGNCDLHQEISPRPSVRARFAHSRQPDGLSVVYTGRYGDLELFLGLYVTRAAAVRTFFLDDGTLTLTVRTYGHRLHLSEERIVLRNRYLTAASAPWTGLRRCPLLCSASAAGAAGFLIVYLNLFFTALYGLHEAYADKGPYVSAAPCRRSAAAVTRKAAA